MWSACVLRSVSSSASALCTSGLGDYVTHGRQTQLHNQNLRMKRRAEKNSNHNVRTRDMRRQAKKDNSELESVRTQDKVNVTNFKEGGDARARGKLEPLVEERLSNDLLRRYWLDDLSGHLSYEDVDVMNSKHGEGNNGAWKKTKNESVWTPLGIPLPKVVTDFVLPAGFPDSVSSDYLRYMLWQFPTNVTGWICSTLVTSSLFKAVGVGVGGGYAAAATATIKWVSKDGLGALGLVLIGGRFGTIFDEDPKQWRMYADVIGSAGALFELYTPLAPDQFLLLGSLGYLFKAVAKGLKDPSFRVIQNHFARTQNLGAVSAKEEVWEVSAKLLGLLIAVILLGMPALSDSYWKLCLIWVSLRSFHLWLRYQSLSGVQFPTINYKRATLLIKAYFQGYSMPGCEECNKSENLLVAWQQASPRIRIGCSLTDVLESYPLPLEVQELLNLYVNEDYILAVHSNATGGQEARVLTKEGASGVNILRSLWQAHWLLLPSGAKNLSSSGSDNCSSFESLETFTVKESSLRGHLLRLSRSMEALDLHFDSFLRELEASGWDLDKIVLKVPSGAPVLVT